MPGPLLFDMVFETTTTTGTGTVTLAGPKTGYRSFAVVGNGNTCPYTIRHQSADQWEVGIGTYTSSGTTLSRDTILASSNGGSAVNFSSGTKDVILSAPASFLGLPKNYIAGLLLSNNATDPNNDIDIESGVARGRENTQDLKLDATLTKQLDAAWAVGHDQGGLLGSGSLAGTVANSASSTTVTGTGTSFTTDFQVGDTIYINDRSAARRITAIASNTSLTVESHFGTGSVTGSAYSRDGGKAPSTWYHLSLIRRSDTGVVDALYHVRWTPAALPTGYDARVYLGSVLTDASSNIRQGTWVPCGMGHVEFRWQATILDVNVTNQGTSAVTRTLSVPPGQKVFALANLTLLHASGGRAYVRCLDADDEAPSATAAPLASILTTGGIAYPQGEFLIRTDASGQITTRSTVTSTTVRIASLGYRYSCGGVA